MGNYKISIDKAKGKDKRVLTLVKQKNGISEILLSKQYSKSEQFEKDLENLKELFCAEVVNENKTKIIGFNYLHTHRHLEDLHELDEEHCIVDRKDLREIQKFFHDNPELVEWIGKGKIHYDRNTNKPQSLIYDL